MADFSEILSQVYLGNSVADYLWVVGALLFAILFERPLSRLLSNIIFRIASKADDNLDKNQLYNLLHKPLAWLIILVVAFFATQHIEWPENWDLDPVDEFGLKMVVHRLYLLSIVVLTSWIVLRFIVFVGLILVARAEKTEGKQDDQIVDFLLEILKITVVIVSIFIALGAVFNVDIGALVAGLGIGGLALALAAKESLENLLASFTIFFDKPFVLGDLVTVNGITGVVEKVGFRSTRLRTLEKSYVTLPNRKMIDDALDNLSLRTFRKASFTIGLTYGTTQKTLKTIVKDLQEYIDNHANTNQDGEVHFIEYGASSMDIMVLYFVDTMDWSFYLKVKEEINFKILEIVESHNTDFAFPTQTLHIESTDNSDK